MRPVDLVVDMPSDPQSEPAPKGTADSVLQNTNTSIFAFLGIVGLMVTAFKFPPLLDYANHYTRMWLIAGGITEVHLAQIYALDWHGTFTNLGIDLMARYLGPLIGVSMLARAILFAAIVLPPIGAIILHRKVFGGSYYWQIAMLYLAWCATLIGGFINFQIGLGLALLFASVDLHLQVRNRRALFVWRLLASLLLTIMHLFSLGFYLALICGLEISPRLELRRSLADWSRLAIRIALAFLACAIFPVLLFLRSPVLPGNALGLETMWNATPTRQMMNLFSAIWTYVSVVDVMLLIPVVLVCTNAARTGRFRMHTGLAIAALGLTIVACLSPRSMVGTGWISWRFPIMAALTGMVMFCPLPKLARHEARVIMLALTLVVFGRTAWISYNWWQGENDANDVISVLESVPPGSAILPLAHLVLADPLGGWQRHYAWGEDTFRHLPTLAIPFAQAFVPAVFTARGKQPLMVLPPWSSIAVPEGNLSSTGVLSCPSWLERESVLAPYLSNWRKRFDYVLVMNANQPDKYVGYALPGGLKLIGDKPFAQLYKIDAIFVADKSTTSPVICPEPLTAFE